MGEVVFICGANWCANNANCNYIGFIKTKEDGDIQG